MPTPSGCGSGARWGRTCPGSSPLSVPPAAQHLVDDGVVAAVPAQLAAALVDLLGGGGERHLLGDLGGGLTDQTHVLDEDSQRRADVVEVTVDHALAAVAEHEGGGRAGAQDLVDRSEEHTSEL